MKDMTKNQNRVMTEKELEEFTSRARLASGYPEDLRPASAVRTYDEMVVDETRKALKDAGRPDLHEFATGAVRSKDADAVRYDLISPIGLRRVAETCAEGAAKYGDCNWEKGMDIPNLLNHALRHAYAFLGGDRSEDHLAHAAWGLLAAMHSEELWPHLNLGLRGSGCVPPGVTPDGWGKPKGL